MKLASFSFIGLVLLAQVTPQAAHAAGPPLGALAGILGSTGIFGSSAGTSGGGIGSISGILQTFNPIVAKLDLPGLGSLANVSLYSLSNALPGLSSLSIPFIGSLGAIPEVGDLPISTGLLTLESVGQLQNALPLVSGLTAILPK